MKSHFAMMLALSTLMEKDGWKEPQFNTKNSAIFIPKRHKPKGRHRKK